MPRGTRKRRLLNPLKSQLSFAEQPRIGAKHEYGPQLRSAINPRSFVSEPSRQDLPLTTWVSPQFTSFEVKNVRRGGRGTKNLFSTSTLNTTTLSILPHARKTTVCKYPSLLFKTSSSVPHRGLLERRAASSIGDPQRLRKYHTATNFLHLQFTPFSFHQTNQRLHQEL
ncbi:RAD9, HUS1, RAD1-interacting nuclear orphan protein 1 isoform X3 [Trichomycterus rosablanca]|uniref:RAD9, HUS1, RAD1-interacting nuclear orphan protein 1 isoform X3 n=1 Tax=Trichomycterus rosablanca TaxID=2290929 RepID=UPI002F35D634